MGLLPTEIDVRGVLNSVSEDLTVNQLYPPRASWRTTMSEHCATLNLLIRYNRAAVELPPIENLEIESSYIGMRKGTLLFQQHGGIAYPLLSSYYPAAYAAMAAQFTFGYHPTDIGSNPKYRRVDRLLERFYARPVQWFGPARANFISGKPVEIKPLGTASGDSITYTSEELELYRAIHAEALSDRFKDNPGFVEYNQGLISSVSRLSLAAFMGRSADRWSSRAVVLYIESQPLAMAELQQEDVNRWHLVALHSPYLPRIGSLDLHLYLAVRDWCKEQSRREGMTKGEGFFVYYPITSPLSLNQKPLMYDGIDYLSGFKSNEETT